MIKNYTSSVPAVRSVQHIEDKLVAYGATNIIKQFVAKRLCGICFEIESNGHTLPFKLPARVDGVEQVLKRQRRQITEAALQKIREQAERTAWKILSEWVDIQMSLIELQQVELLEVFLPYVYDPVKEQTFFESLKESKFKMLTSGAGAKGK